MARTLTRTRILLISLGLLILTVDLGPTLARAEEETHQIVIDQPIPIEDFLKLVKSELDLPLVWDPKSRGLQNKETAPTLKLSGTRDDLFATVRGLLGAYELVVIPIGAGANRKYYIADARATQAVLRLKPTYVELSDENLADYENQDGLFLTTTIQVENMVNLRDARNALNRIVTGQNIGNVTEVPDARAFVVTDFAPNVVAIYRLLRQMDLPVAERGPETTDKEVVFEAIGLEHAPADDAARLLTAHFGTGEPPKASRQRPQGPPQTSDVPPAPRLRIHADLRLNQILVTGMRKDVRRVAAVVQVLDRPRPSANAQIQVIELEHIDAREAAHTLTSLIERSPFSWLQEPGARGLPVVEPHVQTNTLLIHAGKGAAEMLRRVVAELDLAPAEKE